MPSAAVSSEVISEAIPGPHLILASSSPRRIDLIKKVNGENDLSIEDVYDSIANIYRYAKNYEKSHLHT